MNNDLRRCEAGGQAAYFHGWYKSVLHISPPLTEKSKTVPTITGIVEFENGVVRAVFPEQIRFLDKPDEVPKRRREEDITAPEGTQTGKILRDIAFGLYWRGFCPDEKCPRHRQDGNLNHCTSCLMDWLTKATPWRREGAK